MALPPLVFRLGARAYDWMTAHADWRAHGAALARHFPPGRRRRILDLGCGPGVSTLALRAVCPDDEVIGLDLVRPMLRRALEADGARRCSWVQGDAHRLPFRAGSVDAVTGHSFLYLLPGRREALAEIRRVLRPGGVVALLEPRLQGGREALSSVHETLRASGPRLAFTMACWRVAARASGAFGPGELEATLRDAGFEAPAAHPTLHGMGWVGVARVPV